MKRLEIRGKVIYTAIVILYLLLTAVSCRLLNYRGSPVAGEELTYDACEANKSKSSPVPSTLPAGSYLYSETYGWFDPLHFGAGNPHQIIEDVKTAAAQGGGIISIKQDVRNGITGYTGHYIVAGDLSEGEILGVALGIYKDWSIRFEEWQGELPHGLAGPLTVFAIEDLPSHYVSFFAVANDLEYAQIFACYLGPIAGTNNGPPHFVLIHEPTDSDTGAMPALRQLVNERFEPLVLSEAGWNHVSWPVSMRMVAVDESNGRWHFEAGETWYFGWD